MKDKKIFYPTIVIISAIAGMIFGRLSTYILFQTNLGIPIETAMNINAFVSPIISILTISVYSILILVYFRKHTEFLLMALMSIGLIVMNILISLLVLITGNAVALYTINQLMFILFDIIVIVIAFKVINSEKYPKEIGIGLLVLSIASVLLSSLYFVTRFIYDFINQIVAMGEYYTVLNFIGIIFFIFHTLFHGYVIYKFYDMDEKDNLAQRNVEVPLNNELEY